MYNILFIGNSYTYFNDMPTAMFKKIAEAAGYDVNVTSITKGGWTLGKHADANDECGGAVDAALANNKYDYVVIQEQSLRPAVSPELFFEGVRALVKKIRANGAVPLLYSTWGRKEGSAKLTELSLTNKTMTEKIADASRSIANELDIAVAYVGLAFYDVCNTNPCIELYNADMSHPSESGSFLAALTIFSKMFDFDVTTRSFPMDESGVLSAAAKRK